MVKKVFRHSFVKYLIVGCINTLVGFGVIFGLMYYGVIPEIANIIGYIVGILVSYILNKTFTFKSKNPHKRDFVRFCVSMWIAYIINLVVLILTHRYFGINKYIAQIIAGACYTISGYLLSRFYTFR